MYKDLSLLLEINIRELIRLKKVMATVKFMPKQQYMANIAKLGHFICIVSKYYEAYTKYYIV